MPMPFDTNEELRNKIIGLGESSIRKSYYPQLQDRMVELERFHALLDRSREMIVLVEAGEKTIIDINATGCFMLNQQRNTLIGLSIEKYLPLMVIEKLEALYTRGEYEGCCLVETVLDSMTQGMLPVEFTLQSARFGGVDYFVILCADITERKKAETQIYTLAFYDPLTQLPNRQLLNDRMTQALANSQRHRKYGAILFIDLDNFKALNDTKGHHMGDELLVAVAKRIQSILRDGDTLGRLGGDEFIVLLEGLNYQEEKAALEAEKFANRIKYIINQPYTLSECEHTCSPSIGIVLFVGNTHDKDSLLKYADIAMYQAKQAGRNTFCFYDPAMQVTIQNKLNMEQELRTAIVQKQLILYYQPQVNIMGEMVGLEALVRWNHPLKGLVPPIEFIPLAEETGLIISLGNWVLEEACLQLKRWEKKRAGRKKLNISVNVSAKQFQETNFYDTVAEVVKRTKISKFSLKLELTESLIVENIHETISKIKAIRALGIGFSLDDFGTGYSSLSYLKRLPLDELKIDQSFVRDINTDLNDAMIVRTIIDVAQNFDLEVIAEGVETKEQMQFLEENGCSLFQGYFFGRPMPAEEIERLYF
ncbi:MAG: EAL domain-containing protein [Sulfurospirillaceae bacterium]|nr:EAL domain-containing protein [Sulfurospirillaceae bacterium]